MFTFPQALKLCEKLQNLIGSDIDPKNGSLLPIHYVVISPYDRESKIKYLSHFYHSEDSAKSMAISEYSGKYYDVVLVHLNPPKIIDRSIRDYAKGAELENQLPKVPTES